MKRNLSVAALVVVALAASAFAKSGSGSGNKGGGAPAPTAPAPQSKDEEAVAFLVELDNKKFKMNDEESVASVRKLLGFWKTPDVGNGAKSKCVSTIHWFAQRKSSPVVLAAVAALGEVGKGAGTGKLVMLLDAMLLQKDPPADQVAGILAALRNAADPDPGVVKAVIKVIVERDGATAAKAADVFANYGGAPADAKIRIFEELLRDFELMATNAAKPDDKAAVEKWKVMSFPAVATLGGLSKQSFADLPAARKWFSEKGRDPSSWK